MAGGSSGKRSRDTGRMRYSRFGKRRIAVRDIRIVETAFVFAGLLVCGWWARSVCRSDKLLGKVLTADMSSQNVLEEYRPSSMSDPFACRWWGSCALPSPTNPEATLDLQRANPSPSKVIGSIKGAVQQDFRYLCTIDIDPCLWNRLLDAV